MQYIRQQFDWLIEQFDQNAYRVVIHDESKIQVRHDHSGHSTPQSPPAENQIRFLYQ